MGPKKKAGKKGGSDDWEAELGESVAPTTDATETNGTGNDESKEDEETGGGGGGGLMASIQRRGKKAKSKKGTQQDFVEGEDPSAEGANGSALSPADLSSKAPREANLDDEDDMFSQPVKKVVKEKPASKEDDGEGENDQEEDGGRVKTKKEKEKEKKEKEKQRKKEQAAKKKASAPTPQAKQEASKPAATQPKSEAAPAVSEPAAGKKKKIPAHLALIQKQQEERRRLEEEQARLQEEENTRLKEAEERAAEDAQKREESKAAKKAKEKAKIEQLKKEGKFMTKAQKDAQAKSEARMKQMIDSGAKIAGLEEGQDKKKPVYDNRKKRSQKKAAEEAELEKQREEDEARRKLEALKIAEEQAAKAKAEAEKAKADAEAKKDEESEMEDWEAQADAEDGVKESWDAPSDEEHPTTKQSNGKAKASDTATAHDDEDEESEDSDDSEEDSEDDSEDERISAARRAEAARKAAAAERRQKQHEEALAARSKDDLRSPICCILGHVDTGKTKLLDKIRQTNVQEGEAGGITQQIGATYFPVDALKKKVQVVNQDNAFEFRVPGLLVIDTPGHESFTNLRSRGSSLCNMAILVVDIMHGLEPQTVESISLLRSRKTPFIVALNKIDRLYGWKKIDNNGFQDSFSFQNKSTQAEFRTRLDNIKVAFAEQGFNSELFFENKSLAKNVSIVPTSAVTGEGIPDLLKLLVQLTQDRLTSNLMYLSEVECTVLEVKIVEGLGTTIDVILNNGVLHEGDRIVLCGNPEPIATNIRALLTPAEMKELRIKSAYVHNKEIKAAMGIKIAADGLDTAIAGSRLLVVGKDDDEEDLLDEVMGDLKHLTGNIAKSGRGVSVQASTLGSLEALLEFLRVSKIPVANISIGPVFKRDVSTTSIMLEKAKEYAVMLCFDVKVDKDAQEYADQIGVKIFKADIIYHLFDSFTKHMEQLSEQRKEDAKMLAVFPCVLKPVAVFNKKDPIVVGVDVIAGNLRIHTPISAVKLNPVTKVKETIPLGRVTSIERDHKQLPICKKGQPSVAVKIEGANQPLYGRQLEEKDTLYSAISRQSIDTLKEFYRSDVSNDEWQLIIELKKTFDIN